LIAIDDLQWLDNPSARVIEFCSRRLTGPIGVLAARRPGASDDPVPAAIALRDPGRGELRELDVLGDADLRKLLVDRAPDPLPRPTVSRISEASGGNPFYALELSRGLQTDAPRAAPLPLPATLEEVVDAKVAGLADEVVEILLATAVLANPTTDVLKRAFGPDAIAALEAAEEGELIVTDGERVRFAHPLLANGIYARASAPRRRELHRRLSSVVSDPEERARHLAHARVLPDAIDALDEASQHVRARGAPDAAAELLELALELGGPRELLARAAEYHFDAGEVRRSRELARRAVEELDPGEAHADALLLTTDHFETESYPESTATLERALAEAGSNNRLRARIQISLAQGYYHLELWDKMAEAAASAVVAASALGEPGRIAQALALSAFADFCLGRGLDEERLEKALRLEDPNMRMGVVEAPAAWAFLLRFLSGHLDEARALSKEIRGRADERGGEPSAAFIAAPTVMVECLAGDIAQAEAVRQEVLDRGLLEMGATGRAFGLLDAALIAAYSGEIEQAHAAAAESMELFERVGSRPLWHVPLMTLGFTDLSLGDYEAAATRLGSIAVERISGGLLEPTADCSFLYGDAAEALVGAGRIEEAEKIVSWLEERGAALDRVWAIRVGARCRALILAAHGEVEEAERAVERALVEHERLPMPIERARSLLVLGRIRRRLRKRRAAKEALDEALEIFEQVGSPRWREQAQSEIDAIGLRPAAEGDELTPAEARVAELVASGLSNKEVAAALVVSPKTVEAHLGRIYRKLEVRRRSELSARLAKVREGEPAT
jgi:DNA-binding CsgD family transcriptional regulator